MVLVNQLFGFVSGNDKLSCFEVSIHTVHRLHNQYLGASLLCGIPFSFLIILSSEIGQQIYLHVNTCSNVQKGIPVQISMKSGSSSDPFQCKSWMAFF